MPTSPEPRPSPGRRPAGARPRTGRARPRGRWCRAGGSSRSRPCVVTPVAAGQMVPTRSGDGASDAQLWSRSGRRARVPWTHARAFGTWGAEATRPAAPGSPVLRVCSGGEARPRTVPSGAPGRGWSADKAVSVSASPPCRVSVGELTAHPDQRVPDHGEGRGAALGRRRSHLTGAWRGIGPALLPSERGWFSPAERPVTDPALPSEPCARWSSGDAIRSLGAVAAQRRGGDLVHREAGLR